MPKYANAYVLAEYINKAGTYHVKAAEGAGDSPNANECEGKETSPCWVGM